MRVWIPVLVVVVAATCGASPSSSARTDAISDGPMVMNPGIAVGSHFEALLQFLTTHRQRLEMDFRVPSADRSPGSSASIMAAQKRPSASIVPSKGTLFGALVDQREGVFWSQRRVLDFERMVGRKLAIDHYFYWTTPEHPCIGEMPRRSREGWDVSHGRIPMVSWVPEPPDVNSPWLDQFIGGSVDQCLRTVARGLKSISGPVLMRFMHEMNGNWYRWSGPQNGGGSVGELKYRQAWIHAWTIFRDEKVTNVQWVWCPDSSDTPADGSHHWTGYYPGDRYVDWVCVDGYNWNVPAWGPWVEFNGIFSQTMGRSIYKDYASRKPFMIGETGTVEDETTPGHKGRWFLNARAAIKARYPLLKAFVYFSTIADGKDWRVGTSASSIAGFRALALDRVMNPEG